MALYSWFSKAKNNQSTNSQLLSKEPKVSTDKNKYLESYTMWPIATVIQGKQVTPPLKNEPVSIKDESTHLISAKSACPQKASLCTILTVKSTSNTA